MASHVELKPCIQVSHCVREELNVEKIDSPYEKVISIVQNSPRTKIVESDGDYLHAEVTSRIMKYVDDLEISFLPETNNLIIRSDNYQRKWIYNTNKVLKVVYVASYIDTLILLSLDRCKVSL